MGAEHVDNCEHDHIGELESAVDELQARLRDAEERGDTLQRRLNDLQYEYRVLSDGHRRLQTENSSLRAHSGRLVELLGDAWWVEAAEHLQALREMTTMERNVH